MPTYKLHHCGDGSLASLERTFDAHNDEAALAQARLMLSEAYGLPGGHVHIDEARGRVTIGAGYRSHRGTFLLIRPVAAFAP
jgi:hypothetical protein